MKITAPSFRKFLRQLSLALAVAATALTMATTAARAQCDNGCDNGCVRFNHEGTREVIANQHEITRYHMTQQMILHQRWWFLDFFDFHVLPAQMMMAEQLTSVGMQQMEIVGALLDAKHQLESQLIFDQLKAQAHKDYQSSHGMCVIASTARSLYAADRIAEMSAHVMAQRSLDRQLGSANVAATEGVLGDRFARTAQFIASYCANQEGNGSLQQMCPGGAGPIYENKDVSYNRLVEVPTTINMGLTANPIGGVDDQADIFAFTSNIFANSTFSRLDPDEVKIRENNEIYYDMRSVVAKRSVAESSFYSILGMKARGSAESEGSGGYLQIVLQQLGVPEDEAGIMLSGPNNAQPSYYAIMDIMAQKIYQRPEFYTDLYDTPANVARKDVAMRAIGLMVDRDIYKSDLRYESMLSVLLEMELIKHQRKTDNKIIGLTSVNDEGRVGPQ